jgi:serine/threonine protein kinase
MPLSAGTRLGPYEILSPLGAGGMGEVYRARDPRLGRDVAIKVLPGDVASDSTRRQRFEQEARSASALNHPNILTIHDIAETDGTLYIAMELVEGRTLRELIVSGDPLPTRKLLDIAVQTAEGLSKAHAAGIVHRDLKPENLMVSKDGYVKILDFGLAKLTEPISEQASVLPTAVAAPTQPGTVMGTAGYMSPEQASGQPVDFRSDQFSLGSILYEMATGKKAFQRKTGAETLVAIIRDEPEPLGQAAPKSPAPVRWIVERCLAKDPEERYASTKDLARDLKSVRDHLTETPVSGALEPAEPPRARRRGWLLPAALAFVAGAAMAIFAAEKLDLIGPPQLKFQRLTYRRGSIGSARFAPDGQSVVYSASWDGAPPQLFLKRPDAADSSPINLPPAEILSISASGEMSLALSCVRTHNGVCSGTLAQAPLTGGAPREIREKVQQVDWTPDSSAIALVRDVAEGAQLEFPAGKVLYRTAAHLSYPRISPKGDRIAFIDHPQRTDDAGSIALIDLAGKKSTLAGPFSGAQGLAWSSDGREVWFTASTGFTRSLRAVSLSGRQRSIAAVPDSLTLSDISKTGSVLATHDAERLSAYVTGIDGAGERDLSWLNWTLAIDLSEDGRIALLDEEGGSGAYMTGLRPTDGSPIARLSMGSPGGLSYDGKWALVQPKAEGGDVLVPTGPGDAIPLPPSNVQRFVSVSFFPNGKRILEPGAEPGHGPRLYVRELPSGATRPVTPEGFWTPGMTRAVSPDGKSVLAVAQADGATWILPIEGGQPRRIDAIDPARERPIRWTEDGLAVYAREWNVLPYQIIRVELATGKREPWKRITSSDPAGAEASPPLRLSANGKVCLYSVYRKLSTLYVIEGLK